MGYILSMLRSAWPVAAGVAAVFILLFLSAAFVPYSPEMSAAEYEAKGASGLDELLSQTVSKPYGGEEYVPGLVGGMWNTHVGGDPKSFNLLIAERDAETAAVVGAMCDWLVDYDTVKREWKPRLAAFEIAADAQADKLDVIYTLRDDIYWSYYNADGSGEKVPVTSDDVVFWYDEICGDPEFQSSSYNGQFLLLADGTEAHVDIEKIDDKRFVFHFPRIIAEPLLHTNMDFGPSFIYGKAKREGGVDGVMALFGVDTDPRTIPSVGQQFLTQYVPGLRLRYQRNADYWQKDDEGTTFPYIERTLARILSDKNTEYLEFKGGNLESYGARTEDLLDLLTQKNKDYTVYNAEGALGASFWSFNQNPVNAGKGWQEWFSQKEFRQAMSCLLNRDRIISQVYGGLAEPKLDLFPEPNPYYNPEITLQYTYDPAKAEKLLASIGIAKNSGGVMTDKKGRAVEFDLSIPSDNSITQDIASIIMDETAKMGIKVNIRVLDFQKLVEQLTRTYDWQSVIIGLGTILFPTQGSNVWPSNGNLHLWHPLQEKAATDWEARVDYLYNEGSYSIDKEKAKRIWDEYQSIILEQCPVVYLVRPRSFFAIRNRWDQSNFYFDNYRGADTERLFLMP